MSAIYYQSSYRCIDKDKTHILETLIIPAKSNQFYIFAFKQSRRREDDIAIVNAAMSVEFVNDCLTMDPLTGSLISGTSYPVVKKLIVAYGGIAAVTLPLFQLMDFWHLKPWSFETFIQSLPLLHELCYVKLGTPGGMEVYRTTLARNFFIKFFVQVTSEFEAAGMLADHMCKDLIGFFTMDSFRRSLLSSDKIDLVTSILSNVFPLSKISLGLLNGRHRSRTENVSELWPKRLIMEPPSHATFSPSRSQTKGLQHYTVHENKSITRRCPNAACQAVKHLSGDLHVSGTATYLNDMPILQMELHGFLLVSSVAFAKITKIDLNEATKVLGFRCFIDHNDICGAKKIGPMFQDEEVFASEYVFCVGQPIGLVVAETHNSAREAAALIVVSYEKLNPILSIQDAIRSQSFHPVNFQGDKKIVLRSLKTMTHHGEFLVPSFTSMQELWCWLGETPSYFEPDGGCDSPNYSDGRSSFDVQNPLEPFSKRTSDGKFLIAYGSAYIGGQEHFYLEPQCCQCIPMENDEMLVYSSSQDPALCQSFVSSVINIARHRIVCKCKRMGGGFGGKETRASYYCAYVAVAAYKLKKPVRLVLDRDMDFINSGQRHPFLSFYRVCLHIDTLRFVAADLLLYNNGGWSADLSIPVLERACLHAENSYFIPNMSVTGYCCKTNLPSNTAFRGFGGPQGMFLAETYIEHCSAALNLDSDELRYINFYKPGDHTHYHYLIEEDNLRRMWDDLNNRAQIKLRKAQVSRFNEDNQWLKRGIKIVPVKFGMAFTKRFMNQAGALVHAYADGSILVSHTGTEMGQGLHTKVAQVVATAFDVPISLVYIAETATDKVPNGLPTAASSGSDLIGLAALEACGQIIPRLKPYICDATKRLSTSLEGMMVEEERSQVFKEATRRAHFDRVNMSANGFYATPNIDYDIGLNSGRPFHYLAYGLCCSEVEIDVLTGSHRIIRSDIMQDVGNSLNPAIDIGQIEGAFIQGVGLFTIEEIVTMPDGSMFTRGPGTYKIPAFGDIPIDFRVSFLENASNPSKPSVFSSKGVGEPPLFLAASIFFAIRAAVDARRAELRSAKLALPLVQGPELEICSKAHEEKSCSNDFLPTLSPATAERICNDCFYSVQI